MDNATIFVTTVDNISQMAQRFDWPDYLVFVVMLAVCTGIGIYFGFFKTAKTDQDYLVGGRNMSVFPVAISLIASFISGIALLGTPTEIYVYGTQYCYILIADVLMAIIFQYIYLPVFHDLKLTSTFEYLEQRFDKRVRLLGSILSVLGALTWLPIVIYVPALAFNLVTGINIHYVTPAVSLICIFYTCVGGLKAVVWTDVIQTVIMIGAMLLVAVKGTMDVGGFAFVWQSNLDSGRIEAPDFDPDIFKRHTIWSVVFGGMFYMLQACAVNQSQVQRYLSLSTLTEAKRALWIFVVGLIVLVGLCSYCGMLLYATYQHCDPITTQLAKKKDQLLPLLVMDVFGFIPGFLGIFVAGIFSAALSSLSTGLNSLSAVVLEDFYRPFFKTELSETHKQIVLQSSVVIAGVIFVALVFVVEQLGTVLQLTMSITTISAGPGLALFTMGMMLPWVNSTGALIGGLVGLIFMGWLTISTHFALATGAFKNPEKPVSVDGCTYEFVQSPPPALSLELDDTPEVSKLYRLSYMWYTLLGLLVSCIVGLIVSLLCRPLDPRDIDPALLTPSVRKRIPKRTFPNQPTDPDEIILAYDAKSYSISTISKNNLPSYKSDTLAT